MEHEHSCRAHSGGAEAPVMRDPVCGMTVDPATAKHRHTQDGIEHYFCTRGCAEKFAADPGRYIADSAE